MARVESYVDIPLIDLSQSFSLRPKPDCSCIVFASLHAPFMLLYPSLNFFAVICLKPLLSGKTSSFILLIQTLAVFLHPDDEALEFFILPGYHVV